MVIIIIIIIIKSVLKVNEMLVVFSELFVLMKSLLKTNRLG